MNYVNEPMADTSKYFKAATEQVQYVLFRDGNENPKGYPVCVKVSAGILLGVGMTEWVMIGTAAMIAYAII